MTTDLKGWTPATQVPHELSESQPMDRIILILDRSIIAALADKPHRRIGYYDIEEGGYVTVTGNRMNYPLAWMDYPEQPSLDDLLGANYEEH